ncbi:MAG: hypothetical protein IH595_11595 [Bacteroidales bacterium]|nr:hypothetical protein [Bacteroidales bacterium]
MEKKISNILSIILHPLLVPTFFVLIVYQFPIYFLPIEFIRIKYLVLLYVFFMTGVIPALVAFILWRFKVIGSLQMKQRGDRVFPLLVVAVFYYFTYYTLNKNNTFPVLNLFLVGSAILALLTLLINNYSKISLHMISWGGVTGALTGLAFFFHLEPFFWIILVIFLSGIAGYARLKADAHWPRQVYIGYVFGFAVMMALFLVA